MSEGGSERGREGVSEEESAFIHSSVLETWGRA